MNNTNESPTTMEACNRPTRRMRRTAFAITFGAATFGGAALLPATAWAAPVETAVAAPSERCEKAAAALSRMTQAKENLRVRAEKLEAELTQAIADGNEERAAKLQRAVNQVQHRADRVDHRIERLQSFIAENCDPSGGA
jgi:uncharacterized iron-regulated protein